MPVAGPDRRFAAMPGYLGGRFDVCGNKWYGSNHANAQKGLPRSVLTMMLNDKDTGAPLALMSANLLSAARTGGVPGVAAKHLANADSKVVSVIGCGPINKACFSAIMTQLKAVERSSASTSSSTRPTSSPPGSRKPMMSKRWASTMPRQVSAALMSSPSPRRV